MPDARLVYTTWPDPELAAKAAEIFVSERLAACANLIPGALAFFWWRGEVQAETEVVMMLKTTRDRARALRDRLIELHPYETPAFSVLEIDEARSNPTYIDWIRREVRMVE
ncbi:MAG: divalent-cation tolerance protein CutA [Caulobacterales bacterium]|nr:divalent-cation tolerance protein CutA [Caulobacterales bacterium]